MRIATRNIYKGGPVGYGAVQKTIALLQPEVLFLQECGEPQRYAGHSDYTVHWSPAAHGKWGTAILVRKDFHCEPLSVKIQDFGGWLQALTLWVNERTLSLVNIHMPTVKEKSYAYLAGQFLDAVAPLIATGSLVVGGDWNISILAPHDAPSVDLKGSAAVRKKLSDLGPVNAWRHCQPAENPPRTMRYRFSPTSAPFHIDGFFLTPDLLPQLVGCAVLESPDWLDSDHNPVVMELAF